uniref:Putative secreted peptide n=1 Tax=Anopheles braziliensis TaxID=58242 RepID=A0A2M3ZRC5_9DIPT
MQKLFGSLSMYACTCARAYVYMYCFVMLAKMERNVRSVKMVQVEGKLAEETCYVTRTTEKGFGDARSAVVVVESETNTKHAYLNKPTTTSRWWNNYYFNK